MNLERVDSPLSSVATIKFIASMVAEKNVSKVQEYENKI